MEKNYILPLAALRGIVVMPGCTVSFDVLRDISKRAFDEASAKKGNIVLAAQKNPDKENPEFSDLYTFGTLCRIKQLMKLPNGSERPGSGSSKNRALSAVHALSSSGVRLS